MHRVEAPTYFHTRYDVLANRGFSLRVQGTNATLLHFPG